MEVGGLLPIELTAHSAAVLGGSEPLEAVVNELRVLLVEVLMGHDIGGTGVHFATTHLQKANQGRIRPAA